MPQSSSQEPIPEHLEELMVGYVLNALSLEEAAEFERYLQADPRLVAQIGQLEAVMGLMAHTPPRVTAPTELRAKIIKASQSKSSVPALWQRALPAIGWSRIAATVIALVALVVAIDNYHLRQKLASLEAPVSHPQETETYVFSLKGTPAASTSMGSIVLDLHAGKVVMALQNLPPLPEGEAYHLWAFTDRKKILCGRFNTTPTGQIVSTLPLPSKEYSNSVKFVRISRESTTTPPDPKKKALVMTSES